MDRVLSISSAADGKADRETESNGRRKDCRGKAGGAGRGLCETASREGAYRAGLRDACPLPPVPCVLPCLSGERRRRRGGDHHLPCRGRGYAGGRGRLSRLFLLHFIVQGSIQLFFVHLYLPVLPRRLFLLRSFFRALRCLLRRGLECITHARCAGNNVP